MIIHCLSTPQKRESFWYLYMWMTFVTGSNLKILEDTKRALQQEFKMKDLGELKYFLGIEITRSADGILMHQRKYTIELISEVGMIAARPASTPIDMNVNITSEQYDDHINQQQAKVVDDPLIDQTKYQRLIG